MLGRHDEIVELIDIDGENWWQRYCRRTGLNSHSSPTTPRAKEVERSCMEILQLSGLHGAPGSNVKGLVVGSVQSGKTASMLGVVAKALDEGIDVIIVLSGRSELLQLQTLDRLRQDLDFETEEYISAKWRELLPTSPDIQLKDLYSTTTARLRAIIRNKIPVIAVVLKQPDHIRAITRFLERYSDEQQNQIRMLVLDDEVDDGSVLNMPTADNSEAGQVIPKTIATLITKISHLHPENSTAYIGYTATPQAVLLQESINPLFPTDFVYGLRAAGKSDDDINYFEPRYEGRYTGGDTFYNINLLDVHRPLGDDRDEENLNEIDVVGEEKFLLHAFQTYIISAALRFKEFSSTEQVGDFEASIRPGQTSKDASLINASCLSSMMIHPSSQKEVHRRVADKLIHVVFTPGSRSLLERRELIELKLGEEFPFVDLDMSSVFPNELVLIRVEEILKFAEKWSEFNDGLLSTFNSSMQLKELVEVWIPRVLNMTRIKIINSDSSKRPDFGSKWRIAPDLCTIFIAGNVMARGLTVEGLVTTLFYRPIGAGLEDSTMQMQRWFGYRAKHFPATSVFTHKETWKMFQEFHENDTYLKHQIASLKQGKLAASGGDIIVVGGLTGKATGKIEHSRFPLAPPPMLRFRVGDLAITRLRGKDRWAIQDFALELFSSGRDGAFAPGNKFFKNWFCAIEEIAKFKLQVGGIDGLLPLYETQDVETQDADTRNREYDLPAFLAYLKLWKCLESYSKVPGFFSTASGRPWNLTGQADLSAPDIYVMEVNGPVEVIGSSLSVSTDAGTQLFSLEQRFEGGPYQLAVGQPVLVLIRPDGIEYELEVHIPIGGPEQLRIEGIAPVKHAV